ncbi:MAG: DNA replication/repair protein RecF [Bacilli bacterium]|nr:DNA replication/repair protein RecF [Bacilli bacterium]
MNLLNFRNYSHLNLDLNSKMNIIIGKNASGKTNILESVCILALTKTYKNGIEPNLISFGKEKCRLRAKVKHDKVLKNLEVSIEKDNKVLKINKTKIKKIGEYISNLNIIIFTPEDLNIIKGSPSIRRNLLNIELSQISIKYLNTYNEYNKLLKMRNEYLKLLLTSSIADSSYLDVITEKLIEKSITIYSERKKYIDFINQYIDTIYSKITSESGVIIKYETNIELADFKEDTIRKKMKYTFKQNYKKELNYGMTLFGPHRDDFLFYFNNKDLKYFGSQGQQKIAILSFKLAEIEIFKNYNNTSPVLLLDDIFSELDISKRNKLLEYVSHDIQSIITTTDIKNIRKKYLIDAYIYEIKNGKIERRK